MIFHFRPLKFFFFLVFLGAAVFPSGLLRADDVILHLKSGDVVSGLVVSENASQVVISNAWAKALSIPLAEVSKRETVAVAVAKIPATTNAPAATPVAKPPPSPAKVAASAPSVAKPPAPKVALQPKPPKFVTIHVKEQLAIKDLPGAVHFVSVLPGERYPLRALTASGKPLQAKWRASGGELALGDHVAVWQAPLQPGIHRVTGYAVVDGKTVKYDQENTGYGWRTDVQLGPTAATQPTTCQMKRPG